MIQGMNNPFWNYIIKLEIMRGLRGPERMESL